VRQERPRFEVPRDTHRRLLEKFVAAAKSGERGAIRALFDDDAQVISDGGGKVRSFAHALIGGDRVTNLYWAVSKRLGEQVHYRLATINGEAGVLRYVNGQIESAQAFVTDGERIVSVYTIRNPDKLASIAPEAA
jgi:RNA polymerase sigma-70 factor (ECF subfamily)